MTPELSVNKIPIWPGSPPTINAPLYWERPRHRGCVGVDDYQQFQQYCEVGVQYQGVMKAGVTPPVIPPYTIDHATPTDEPLGRFDPWEFEQDHFRSATAGRGYGSMLLDAEIMQMEMGY